MTSRDSKLDNSDPASAPSTPTEPATENENDQDPQSADSPIRLSVKGAVRESGRLPKFEVNLDPNSRTAQFEKDSMLREQLESVDFYIEQGFLEVAFSTLERLEMVFPNHPLISERLDRMASMELQSPPVKPAEPVKSTPTSDPEPTTDTTAFEFRVMATGEIPAVDMNSEIGLDLLELKYTLEPASDNRKGEEISVEIGGEENFGTNSSDFSGMVSDAGSIASEVSNEFSELNEVSAVDDDSISAEIEGQVSSGTVDNSDIAERELSMVELPELDAVEPMPIEITLEADEPQSASKNATEADGSDDLAISFNPAQLEERTLDDIVTEPLGETTEEEDITEIPETLFQTISDDQADIAALNELTSAQNGFLSLFDELENELDETVEADFHSHFNVGQAYFEIELFDDAVEEFQAAYRTIQATGTHPKAFQCCMMLGRCFRIKSMPRPALIWFRRALDAQGRKDEDYCEARYELAGVHEELGERDRAIELFRQIERSVANYRDVSARIAQLQSR